MTWEYLDAQTDYRIAPIAEYLKDKVKDQVILDLDCLRARLIHHIPHTFKAYIGNDLISEHFPVDIPNTTFYNLPDAAMPWILTELDILVVMGHGGYEYDPNPKESLTLTQTIHMLMDKFEPKFLILEACQMPAYSLSIEDIKNSYTGVGYVEDVHVYITPDTAAEELLLAREIICLRHLTKSIATT